MSVSRAIIRGILRDGHVASAKSWAHASGIPWSEIMEDYELDDVYARLRAAEAEICELRARLDRIARSLS